MNTSTPASPASPATAQHTPTPWAIIQIPGGDSLGIESTRDGSVIGKVYHRGDGLTAPNAAFIVRAVNTHAQLVAALEEAQKASLTTADELVTLLPGLSPMYAKNLRICHEMLRASINQARAALHQAKEA